MNHELAEELKEAGLPWYYVDGYTYPDLEDLIDACGEDFRWLKRRGDKWMAQGRPHPVGNKEPKCYGDTHEEAVARLWLALNKH